MTNHIFSARVISQRIESVHDANGVVQQDAAEKVSITAAGDFGRVYIDLGIDTARSYPIGSSLMVTVELSDAVEIEDGK